MSLLGENGTSKALYRVARRGMILSDGSEPVERVCWRKHADGRVCKPITLAIFGLIGKKIAETLSRIEIPDQVKLSRNRNRCLYFVNNCAELAEVTAGLICEWPRVS